MSTIKKGSLVNRAVNRKKELNAIKKTELPVQV
jgi:hypothetical protein